MSGGGLLGGLIGGGIGFVTGGPVGAAVGFAGGYAAGSAADDAKEAAGKQKKALEQMAAAQRHAAEVNNRQQQILARQSRTEAIRKARSLTGTMLSAAAAAGVGSGSSSLAGGIASLQSQIASNIGTSNTLGALEEEKTSALTAFANAQGSYGAAQLDNQSAINRGQTYSSIFSNIGSSWTKLYNSPKFQQAYANSNIFGR